MGQNSRRRFLVGSAATAAGLTVATSLAGKVWADPLGKPPGIQLYSVAAQLKTDVPGTLRALRAIGFQFVELASFVGLSPSQFRKALDDAGLRCPSAHFPFSAADPSPFFEDAHAVGAHYAISSLLLPPGMQLKKGGPGLASITLDDFKRTAQLANSIGAKAKQAGLQYAYHNHNYEFRDRGNGQTGYDLLLKETDPSLVKFELDCGWMVAAGHNPVDYFRRFPNRYRLLHIKDFVKGSKVTTDLSGSDRPVGTELGRGYIDYKPIFAAAKRVGIDYYFSEQEPPIVGMTEVEAAKVNYDYLHAL